MSTRVEFIQIQYTGWPDFGAPSDTTPIIRLVEDVRQTITSPKKGETSNILVHCSAGVGRTGTFIALYQMMEEMDDLIPKYQENGASCNMSMDIFNTVLNLRSKRVYMVSLFPNFGSFSRIIKKDNRFNLDISKMIFYF